MSASSGFFPSLTGWVYQPRQGKRKRFPLPVSAVFSSASQSILATNPAAVCPFQPPACSVVIPSVQTSIGHAVCEFSVVNYLKNSGFIYCSESYTYGSVDVVKTIPQSFSTPLFLLVLLCTAPLPPSLYLLFLPPLKFFWHLHCPQVSAIVFVAPGYLLLSLGLFVSLLLSTHFLLSYSCFFFCLHLTSIFSHQLLTAVVFSTALLNLKKKIKYLFMLFGNIQR